MRVLGVGLVAFVVAPAFAQRGMGGPMGPSHYDPKSEVTVKGTIEQVREVPHPGGRHMGEHLMLKTGAGTLDVALGPVDFWKRHGVALATGDSIEVTGSKSSVDGAQVLLAREVRKGEKVVTLRDAQGVPSWSRGRRAR